MNKLRLIIHNRRFLAGILICYLLILVYWMLFAFGRIKGQDYMYNLIPFRTISNFMHINYYSLRILLVNLVGNIGVFMPFGVFLPLILKYNKIRLFLTFETGLFTLELMQLVTKRGSFDVDDIILNTIGAILGYAIYKLGANMILNFEEQTRGQNADQIN